MSIHLHIYPVFINVFKSREYRKNCVNKSFRIKYQGVIFSMSKKVEEEKNKIVKEFF